MTARDLSPNEQLNARKTEATPRGIAVLAPFFAVHAEDSQIWDIEGRPYIDFGAGIGVLNTGHRHPKVVKAVARQLEHFTHTAYQVVPYASYIELAERLNALTPGTHRKKTALFTTGAEAVENAIKVARAATGRPGVIALSGGFHGRTFMGMALTGKIAPYKRGFGPFPGSVFHVPAPIELHGTTPDDSLRALETLFKADIDPWEVAAIVIEPVQGEGGFYVTPPEFMRGLRRICDEYGILLIADEVQTGFARTGRLFAMEHYDVLPDLMTMAKSLAGGLPLSALTGRAEVMDAPAPGGLGGTYAGNPLAVAAAHAVLDVIDEEGLCERAESLGQQLRTVLTGLQAKEDPASRRIIDVRGLGAMMAMEFCKPGTLEPDAEYTKLVQARALEKGLLLLTAGVNGNVIRFLFPLTIGQKTFRDAMSILERVIV